MLYVLLMRMLNREKYCGMSKADYSYVLDASSFDDNPCEVRCRVKLNPNPT